LNVNPNVLILVEGIEIYPRDIKANPNFTSTNSGDYHFNWWGGNLRGVRDNPINLGKFQNKLVYSPHDYGPTVYQQPWFQGGFTFDSLMKDCWRDNWFFIHEEGIAPLLIGEWGGFMSEPNLTWMTYLRRLIKENRLHHTFWCFNANSGDTGGLVLHDFATWDEEKYAFVKEVLWQQDGKFVGLDSSIPLGKNGISLSQVR
jgi:aryl-phospho-beta-D-glucosidase BglC (GH1 family)